jgi:hypothetical protein
MNTQWKAIRALNSVLQRGASHGMDALFEVIDPVSKELPTAIACLDILDDWLESRGLPNNWTGPLDAWGWVIVGAMATGELHGPVLEVIHGSHENASRAAASYTQYTHTHRWDDDDLAMNSIRAEALLLQRRIK